MISYPTLSSRLYDVKILRLFCSWTG